MAAQRRTANAMARRLADGVRDLPGVAVAWPVEANAVFVRLPGATRGRPRRSRPTRPTRAPALVRLMCSWDTTEADVDALLAALDAAREALATGTGSRPGVRWEPDRAGVGARTPGTARPWT